MKSRRCRHCKEPYEPKLPMQRACSVKCAAELAKQLVEKKQRKVWREKKARLKTRRQHMQEAQAIFNRWIREVRDSGRPCISCLRHHQGQYHAGHYRTTAACSALRFDPRNVHKQCSACNSHLSGNLIEYRLNLLRKVGPETMEWLEGPHPPKRWTVEELVEIKRTYRKKLREAQGNELQQCDS